MKLIFRRRRGSDVTAAERQSVRKRDSGEWLPRIAGIVLSVVSMHLLVVRPLLSRVDRLEGDLHVADLTLTELADSGRSLWETNDFLKGLRVQREELNAARETLQQWRQFHQELRSAENASVHESPPLLNSADPLFGGVLQTAPLPPALHPLRDRDGSAWQMHVRPTGDQPRRISRFSAAEVPKGEELVPVTLADWFASSADEGPRMR